MSRTPSSTASRKVSCPPPNPIGVLHAVQARIFERGHQRPLASLRDVLRLPNRPEIPGIRPGRRRPLRRARRESRPLHHNRRPSKPVVRRNPIATRDWRALKEPQGCPRPRRVVCDRAGMFGKPGRDGTLSGFQNEWRLVKVPSSASFSPLSPPRHSDQRKGSAFPREMARKWRRQG